MGMPDVQAALPDDLSGLTALDLGGYNHGMAQWCLDRGAVSATMVDSGECEKYWGSPSIPADSCVKFVRMDLHDWDTPADVVICSNVIYHIDDPLAALKHMRGLTRRLFILRTSFVDDALDLRDGWRWYPEGSGHSNGCVPCRPTLAGLEDYLHRAGFPEVEWIETEGDHTLVRCPIPKVEEAYAET